MRERSIDGGYGAIMRNWTFDTRTGAAVYSLSPGLREDCRGVSAVFVCLNCRAYALCQKRPYLCHAWPSFCSFFARQLEIVPILALFVPSLAVTRPLIALFEPLPVKQPKTRPSLALIGPFLAQVPRMSSDRAFGDIPGGSPFEFEHCIRFYRFRAAAGRVMVKIDVGAPYGWDTVPWIHEWDKVPGLMNGRE